MGLWSGIVNTGKGILHGAGFYAKNGLKIGAGYGIGSLINEASEELTGHSLDPAVAGLTGVATAYAVPKIFGKDDKKKESLSTWGKICKTATIGAGLLFVGNGAINWYNDMKDATDNIYTPKEGEFLHMASKTDSDQTADRSVDTILDGIDMENVPSAEMTY